MGGAIPEFATEHVIFPPGHISEAAPFPVKRPLMFQGWYGLTFLHWRYAPETIRPLVPAALQVDVCDGSAWVGMTPFLLAGLRPPGLPALPWISRFPEMNIRTYVRGPDGERGIWFFSLEAARFAAVAGARISYGLPYRWARMRVRQTAGGTEYTSRRRFGAGHASIKVQPGARLSPSELERFLTARYRLYTKLAGRLAFAQVEHEPWPLHSAAIIHLEQDVIQNSGVPPPKGAPLAHFSPGVYVRIGRPQYQD